MNMIQVDLKTFHQSREVGNVTGVIFLELKEQAFPERGWFDFPVSILGWWIDAWFQLEVSTTREVQWLFMDGPYAATLTKVDGSVSCGALQSLHVFTSVLEAAESVVAHCEQTRMISKDFELLRANVRRLKLKANLPRAEDAGFAVEFVVERTRRH